MLGYLRNPPPPPRKGRSCARPVGATRCRQQHSHASPQCPAPGPCPRTLQVVLLGYLNPCLILSLLDRDIVNRVQARIWFFLEYSFRKYFVNFQRAFEIVLLDSVAGSDLFCCGFWYFPSLVSSIWLACTLLPGLLHLHFHGWSYDDHSLSPLELPEMVDTVDTFVFWSSYPPAAVHHHLAHWLTPPPPPPACEPPPPM